MNRCRAKFAWFFGYKQFRCHSYLESCEAYCAEKRVPQQTRSPGNFASAFEVSCYFKGRVVVTERLSKLCYTIVAKMPHRYMEWATNFNCVIVNSKDKWTLKVVGTLRVP